MRARLRPIVVADTEGAVTVSAFDIAAFGEILIDFTYHGRNEKGQRLFAQNPGGAPANMLVAAGKLGARTAFLGKAGDDMHGRFLKEALEQESIDTRGFLLDKDFFTTLAFVDLDEKGERSFSFARKPGADAKMEIEDLHTGVLENSRIFHVGSVSLTDEPSRSATLYALKKTKKNGSHISYDPNYRSSLWKSEDRAKMEMRSLISYADVMKISDEETSLLTDADTPEEAAEILCSQGVKIAVVTLGAKGAYVRNQDGGLYVPGFPSKVVDTTGAGDAFWGGFLYKICEIRKNPEEITLEEAAECTKFANAVASLCVESKGSIPAMPEMNNVMERLRE